MLTNKINYLEILTRLAWCLSFSQGAWGIDDHLFGPGRPNGLDPNRGRPEAGWSRNPKAVACGVSPTHLAEFANGEKFDYRQLVTYVSSPSCLSMRAPLAQMALAQKINFSQEAPWRLDHYANSVMIGDFESNRRTEEALARNVPSLLEQTALPTRKLLPLTGQLALLSPAAGRTALAQLIVNELSAGSDRLAPREDARNAEVGAELARTVEAYGAAEIPIALELAESVRRKAMFAQADSLEKVFRGLVAAAGESPRLVPTLNLSAEALAQGVRRSQGLYGEPAKQRLLASCFGAIHMTAVIPSDAFDDAATRLDEAMAILAQGKKLEETRLKRFWNDVVWVLTVNPFQNALAGMLAGSLTPEVLLLPQQYLAQLFQAARNYPSVAASLQRNFLLAWQRIHEAGLKQEQIVKVRSKYFTPFVAQVFQLSPESIEYEWLLRMHQEGFLQDAVVEKTFPRLMLHALQHQEKAAQVRLEHSSVGESLGSVAQRLVTGLQLSRLHVPVLLSWVERNEGHE